MKKKLREIVATEILKKKKSFQTVICPFLFLQDGEQLTNEREKKEAK